MIKRVGVLTSGGDAPGMNAAVRAIVRAGIKNGLEMFAIYEGYKGLVENQIQKVDRTFVSEILMRGGTILRSARLPSFKNREIQEIAVNNLRNHGIDALVVIGGDGTYRGAMDLTKLGINCIGLPGTIDNDIACTDYTIGFDTCLNTITEAVDKLRDTTSSHQRCSIIEVMGNRCGDLALFSGTSCGADLIISPEYRPSDEEIITKLRDIHINGAKHALVIVSEKLFDNLEQFAQNITFETGFDTRVEVLGRIQRGGAPSAFDRVLAARLGVFAIELLLKGKGGRCVGMKDGRLQDFDIVEALAMPRDIHEELIDVISTLK